MPQTLDSGGLGAATDAFRSVAGCFAVAQHDKRGRRAGFGDSEFGDSGLFCASELGFRISGPAGAAGVAEGAFRSVARSFDFAALRSR